MKLYQVEYSVTKGKKVKKTFRTFVSEEVAKSEVTFVKNIKMKCGVVTATKYKKIQGKL